MEINTKVQVMVVSDFALCNAVKIGLNHNRMSDLHYVGTTPYGNDRCVC